jgi:D-aminopeptidase
MDRDQQLDGTPLGGRALDPLFAAVVEAAEEAVLNSMFTAPTVVGRDGNTSESLHSPDVLALLR